MQSIASRPARVKASRQPLAVNEERTVSLKDAIYHVTRSDYVALSVALNHDGNASVMDVTKALVLRNLRRLHGRVATVHLCDLFGTLTIGVVDICR